MLFGVAEVEFDLKSQTVPVDDFLSGQIQVAGEQVDVGKDTRRCIGLGKDDDIE